MVMQLLVKKADLPPRCLRPGSAPPPFGYASVRVPQPPFGCPATFASTRRLRLGAAPSPGMTGVVTRHAALRTIQGSCPFLGPTGTLGLPTSAGPLEGLASSDPTHISGDPKEAQISEPMSSGPFRPLD